MTNPALLIEIKDLSHVFQGQEHQEIKALSAVNLTVKAGEFLVILGANGSGKSTLAKHLNALLLPTEGNVIIDGLNTDDEKVLWDIRQRVGMVFQNPDNQIVATIVEDDVAFGPENLGLPPAIIKERVEEALFMVDMLEYRQHAPHLLSGGQKQRVAIAGIVAMRPKIIVLDEATAMLDPKGRQEVMSVIDKLKQEGMTVILITHHMSEATLADRVVLLDQGKIKAQGTPREVFAQREMMRDLGLDIPPMSQLAEMLKEAGIIESDDVLDVEDLVKLLCP
ncbi:MAG: energy-coupling factor transporter ATPase [Firmicutes bacterium]|nr:energy-coupling factor transporter ATPase [Bacillota bacterium]